MKLTLKITAPIEIGGRNPGEEFEVEATDAGMILDPYWRARLEDEAAYACGAVTVVTLAPPPASEPEGPVAPPPRKKAAS